MKKDFSQYALPVLRYGLALVFFWFGISQLLDPDYFIGYLPDFLFFSGYAQQIVIANGIGELILATLLAVGLFTRIAAILLAIHLAIITFEVGLLTETGARDFGLTIAVIAIALAGPDKLCLDKRRLKK